MQDKNGRVRARVKMRLRVKVENSKTGKECLGFLWEGLKGRGAGQLAIKVSKTHKREVQGAQRTV